ncbi:MAG TPA: ATP-binding cassette domain-containing protein [Xanthobacteraceae bacterium]|nr:ATP-binding cassette domain-containing protein [Xanthobacteraceae bacterium]
MRPAEAVKRALPIETAAADPDRLLDLRKVCKQFGTDPAVNALIDVDLELLRGEWLSITGPSGSGKSTLLNILGCLDRPTLGTYLFDRIETTTLNENERAGLRSRRIGFIFQSFHLLPYRTVLENVMLAEVYRQHTRGGRRERALEEIRRVGLAHRADFPPSKLSGGECQRVAIARALMGSPSLLLCDEPTGNLDSKNTESILDFFTELNNQGMTIIVVTHDENVARQGTRRVHMKDGQVASGSEPASPRQVISLRPASSRAQVSSSGITKRDLLAEAIAGIFARPARMALTVLGIVIGMSALVATVGLTRTAANRIISQFDQLAATELFITARPGLATGTIDPRAIPWDAPERLGRLNGVAAAGLLSEVNVHDALVRASPVVDPVNQTALRLAVRAASPGLFRAVRADLASGRLFDGGHSARADRVAVLGPDAARRLGISGVERLPAIYIGDHLYLVVGVLRDVVRRPELLGSVIIPEGTAQRHFGLLGPGTVVVETKIGAASLIALLARAALRPDDQRALRVQLPLEPRRVRDEVQTDLNVMFLLLGGLSLVVGALGIANITLVGVMERTPEIGLRRAIGATRRHIAVQFLFESASMGIVGGLIGSSAGVLIVVGVSAYQVWTPVLDPLAPLLAPVVGGVIGLLSGVYPASRAARLEPAEAFRH